jgi:hypothetical protein
MTRVAPELKAELELLTEAGSAGLRGLVADLLALEAAQYLDPPAEKTFDLMRPVTHAGETYSRITLREPPADELDKIERHADGARYAISLLGALPIGAVNALSARDYNAMRAYIGFFLTATPPPSAT